MERAQRVVRNCGKYFKDQPSIAGLTTALTPEEEKSPFAKYYHRGIKPISPEQAQAFRENAPMDPAQAFMPQDYIRHMCKPGYNPVENGYCVLPNGVSYTAALTRQDGITDEKMRFYNENFAPDPDLFYKIWCPGAHLRHMADGAIEDVGRGMLCIHFIQLLGPKDLGIDNLQALDPGAISIDGSYAQAFPADGPADAEPLHITLINYTRDTPTGREIRHRFWIGLTWKDGRWESALAPGARSSEEYAQCLGAQDW